MVNYKNRERKEIFEEFYNFFLSKNFKLEDINLKVMPYFPCEENSEDIEISPEIESRVFDCTTSRIVAQNGIYCCPLRVNDYRARVGSKLDDCSNLSYLDCAYCKICTSYKTKIQINDWV